jgi:hypothetical protein
MTKTKCSFIMYKVPKSEFFKNWGPLIEHDSHWINLVILIIMNEKKTIHANIRFGRNLFHLTSKKK